MDLVFDIESNGLLDTVDTIHCISLTVTDALAAQVYANQDGYDCLEEALELMTQAESLTGHNIIGYDLPALKKVLGWEPRKSCRIIDTLVISRLIHTDLYNEDMKTRLIPTPKMYGSHSLKAWGFRLGEYKGEFGETADWDVFTDQMADYCMQDTIVTANLAAYFSSLEYSVEALQLEHDFATIMQRQMQHGFSFDVHKGKELYVSLLKRQEELGGGLRDAFGSWYVSEGEFMPKVGNKKRGTKAGSQYTKLKRVDFNPNSRDHIAKCLKGYGWTPKDYTPGGHVKIDETILSGLSLPHIEELIEHFLVSKRISQLAEGNNAWLKLERGGRIYGYVNSNGAVTGRCTHSKPNVAQVPASYSPYGSECRGLFRASKDRVLVGCDADGLELRTLAGYMRRYDDGAYCEAAISGDKSKGTDIHSINKVALGIEDRDVAKTWFYAFIYGAGDGKLGAILNKGPKVGKKSRAKFLQNVTGLSELTTKVKQTFNRRGYLIGMDGRRLHVRSEHSSLNTLLQSAGAVIMKKALVLLDERLQKIGGLIPGVDYEFVANIHDEWQIECKERYARIIGGYSEGALTRAGDYYEFGCKITGTSQTGPDWASTH